MCCRVLGEGEWLPSLLWSEWLGVQRSPEGSGNPAVIGMLALQGFHAGVSVGGNRYKRVRQVQPRKHQIHLAPDPEQTPVSRGENPGLARLPALVASWTARLHPQEGSPHPPGPECSGLIFGKDEKVWVKLSPGGAPGLPPGVAQAVTGKAWSILRVRRDQGKGLRWGALWGLRPTGCQNGGGTL